jgi:ATP-dependent Clp protease adaptor protein ClpS
MHVCELTPLNTDDAIERTVEAHKTGHSLLLTTHKERAELFQEQFAALRPPIGIRLEEAR